MKKSAISKFLWLVSLSGALLSHGLASANTLTFEDIDPGPAGFDVMPSPYSGFSFSGWLYGPDVTYTPASGVIDLFTDYADPLDPGAYVITINNEISRTTDFIFNGASFSGYSGVTFELWNDGSIVYTSASLPDAPGATPYSPTFLASGYSNPVDAVRVSGVQGYYSMDNFTYQDVSAVPEPASALLMLAGLAGIATASKRRKSVF